MTAEATPTPEAPPASEPEPIVARAASYYRRTRYVVFLMVLGCGLWFLYDGFVRYPREQANFDAAPPEQRARMEKPHNDFDIRLQKEVGFVLLPFSFVLLGWFLYASRGEYRLAGGVPSVPGHPPVPLEHVTELDMSRWDRKGIAAVAYQLPGSSKQGRFRLDDFVYERTPTDAIVERLEAQLPAAEDVPHGDASGGGDEPAA